jgi:hypothetical protein
LNEPFSYPRAGAEADPRLSSATAELLRGASAAGVPLWKLGPSLVKGFFRFLDWLPNRSRGVDKSQVPGLYLLLGSGTGPLKMSKKDAAYQDRPVSQQRCGNCSSAYRHVVSGDMICSQIEGKVEAKGWCRIWNQDRL